MNKSSQSCTSFDLQLPTKTSDKFIIRKNDKMKNIYDTNFQEVPIIEQEALVEQEEDFAENVQQVPSKLKQYLSSLVYPSYKYKSDNTLPDITLELEFVNSYDPLGSIQNLFYVGEDQIVYSAAILGIVMNTKTRKQRYFGVYGEQTKNTSFDKFHRAPIVSIDYEFQKRYVATGSLGINPQICIWNPDTLELIIKFHQGKLTKQVSIIRFFMKGQFVITLQRSDKTNIIHLWTIKGQKKLSDVIEGTIYNIATYQNKFLATCSKGCFQYTYSQTNNTIQRNKISDFFTVGASYLDGQPLYSNCYGKLIYKQKEVKLDDECIFCINVKNDKIYASGSSSKKLFILNKQLQITKQYILSQYTRSIDIINDKILLGLRNGIIQQIQNQEHKTIIEAHFVGELWGLTYNQQCNTFITAGEDNKILNFDIETKSVIKTQQINKVDQKNKLYEKGELNYFSSSKQSRAIAVYQDKMVYTTNYGEIVLTIQNTDIRHSYQMEDISETIQFSSNGEQIAVGCMDDCILIFNVTSEKGFDLVATLSGHESYVNDLDFNLQGNYLRSAAVNGELRYWNLQTFKQIILSNKNCSKQQKQTIRDNDWVGLCRFCWQTQKIFKQKMDHQFFNKIAISKSEDYLAVGEDDNCLRLYRVPASKHRKFRGHACHVINVCWSKQDEYLASIGGPDRSLFIWKVKQAEEQ